MDRDDVSWGFRRYVPHPSFEDVAWWVRAFPHCADDIRSLAGAAIGIQALAALAAREEDLVNPGRQQGSRSAAQLSDGEVESY